MSEFLYEPFSRFFQIACEELPGSLPSPSAVEDVSSFLEQLEQTLFVHLCSTVDKMFFSILFESNAVYVTRLDNVMKDRLENYHYILHK